MCDATSTGASHILVGRHPWMTRLYYIAGYSELSWRIPTTKHTVLAKRWRCWHNAPRAFTYHAVIM